MKKQSQSLIFNKVSTNKKDFKNKSKPYKTTKPCNPNHVNKITQKREKGKNED